MSVLRGFQTKIWKKVSAVGLREVSALERVQLQRDKCNSAGTKFVVCFREVSALEKCLLGESWLYCMTEKFRLVAKTFWAVTKLETKLNMLLYTAVTLMQISLCITHKNLAVCKDFRDFNHYVAELSVCQEVDTFVSLIPGIITLFEPWIFGIYYRLETRDWWNFCILSIECQVNFERYCMLYCSSHVNEHVM